MAAYKRTRITIETDQILIIRRSGCIHRWCRVCSRETEMLSLSQAAALTGVAQPLLLDSAKAGKWHLAEASGSSLICLDSLLNATRGSDPINAIEPSKDKKKDK